MLFSQNPVCLSCITPTVVSGLEKHFKFSPVRAIRNKPPYQTVLHTLLLIIILPILLLKVQITAMNMRVLLKICDQIYA